MALEDQKLPGSAIEANSISELEISANLLSLIQSGGGPKVISYSYSGSLLSIGGNEIVLTGSGFDSNIEISIDGNIISNVTVTNSNSITFTTNSFSSTGNFLIYLRNPDGSSTIAVPEITIQLHIFQGITSGYTSGGLSFSPSDIIDKFPFATNANATDVGDLSQARWGLAGQSSDNDGYNSGGSSPPGGNYTNIIDKFPFASNANATDVGDLTQPRYFSAGQSSGISGYTSGGLARINPTTTSRVNTIDKFPFASNANATDVGNLTLEREAVAGQSSSVNGYTSGGSIPPNVNTIDKFPFASNANATDVGDLTVARRDAAGQSSDASGYTSGGGTPTVSNVIDKFPFASNANATDVGDLTQSRGQAAGQSSSVSGYTSGGYSPLVNTIDKFPFASNANATDVGDLTQSRRIPAGQQV